MYTVDLCDSILRVLLEKINILFNNPVKMKSKLHVEKQNK